MPRKIIPYQPHLKELARKLRNDATMGEVLLWNELKSKKLNGFDFHRQKPLLNYIVDFYCAELEPVLEVDGKYHNHTDVFQLDLEREHELNKWGLTVLRFTEVEVRNDMLNVLRTLETYILQYQE